ncbi:hypothetical protein Z517_02937 [Fonsecaea pedrosoi CBS 271.37]|uniref:Uncharacterized protein n=1 Tax=Fonsecaea pedrosoi CBS 271.37 TaxID=1442368 RepID=A0A0D2E0U1_9EURO|nr:uncharacterized protein Z517_02937 [Fonsecaea pedrosoi CBS 271.37]KIW83691.1 hypothetical protein Z517_02937 [Fonsecaea pedrosoi CBS 271.37]
MPNAATQHSIRITKRDIVKLLGEDSKQPAPGGHPSVLVDRQSAAFAPNLVGAMATCVEREQDRKDIELWCVLGTIAGSAAGAERGAVAIFSV